MNPVELLTWKGLEGLDGTAPLKGAAGILYAQLSDANDQGLTAAGLSAPGGEQRQTLSKGEGCAVMYGSPELSAERQAGSADSADSVDSVDSVDS